MRTLFLTAALSLVLVFHAAAASKELWNGLGPETSQNEARKLLQERFTILVDNDDLLNFSGP